MGTNCLQCPAKKEKGNCQIEYVVVVDPNSYLPHKIEIAYFSQILAIG